MEMSRNQPAREKKLNRGHMFPIFMIGVVGTFLLRGFKSAYKKRSIILENKGGERKLGGVRADADEDADADDDADDNENNEDDEEEDDDDDGDDDGNDDYNIVSISVVIIVIIIIVIIIITKL